MTRRHRGVPWGLALALTLAANMLAQLPLAAQDATPLWSMYGVPVDEFPIGIVLYPFDEVDEPAGSSKFMTLGDTVRTLLNAAVMDEDGAAVRERVLADRYTTPGEIIASDVVVNWTLRETNRFPGARIADSTEQNVSWRFENPRDRLDASANWYVVAKLRLPEPSAHVPMDSAVLRLRLYRENSQDQPVLCETFTVTKGSLGDPPQGKYSDVAFPVDMAHCGSGPGPLDPTGGSRRMNLSVEWVGTEAVGLRSISLRNEAMQIMMDTSSERRGASGEE